MLEVKYLIGKLFHLHGTREKLIRKLSRYFFYVKFRGKLKNIRRELEIKVESSLLVSERQKDGKKKSTLKARKIYIRNK